MKNLDIKKLALCLTVFASTSGSSYGDTVSVNAASKSAFPKQPTLVSCPSEFQQVKISEEARQCQAFDESMTAVMVYHSPRSTREMLGFYQAAHPLLKAHSPVSGRTLLTSEDKAIRVVISPDNAGSQVDILVTSTRK